MIHAVNPYAERAPRSRVPQLPDLSAWHGQIGRWASFDSQQPDTGQLNSLFFELREAALALTVQRTDDAERPTAPVSTSGSNGALIADISSEENFEPTNCTTSWLLSSSD